MVHVRDMVRIRTTQIYVLLSELKMRLQRDESDKDQQSIALVHILNLLLSIKVPLKVAYSQSEDL